MGPSRRPRTQLTRCIRDHYQVSQLVSTNAFQPNENRPAVVELRRPCSLRPHIRNIGTNVGKDHGIRVELREAFQGHAYKGMNLFYEEGFDYRAMVPLVNMIGETYLGDEHLKPAGEE